MSDKKYYACTSGCGWLGENKDPIDDETPVDKCPYCGCDTEETGEPEVFNVYAIVEVICKDGSAFDVAHTEAKIDQFTDPIEVGRYLRMIDQYAEYLPDFAEPEQESDDSASQ